MSDFVDSEAEESGEDLEETKEVDEKENDDDVEDDDEQDDNEEVNDIIDDNPIEEDDSDDDDEEEEEGDGLSRKRKLESDDEEVDDDDLDLIQENTGIKLKKKKHSRVKLLDSDDDEEHQQSVNERDQIAHDLFEQDDDEDVQSTHSSRPASRQSHTTYTAVEDIGDESDEPEEIDDFIVDDDDQPIHTKKVRKRGSSIGKYTDSALQEAQDIFGLEFDLSEFDADVDDEEDDDEDSEDEERTARMEQRKAKKKSARKSIYQIYEPAELERGHLTIEDNKIKVTDVPERFQLRSIPVKTAGESELDEEAEWIYKQAFMEPPISQQNFQDAMDSNKHYVGFEPKPVTTIPRIKAALKFMKQDQFEVPFIAMYRKEYVEPELKKDDLWKVYEWDEKWTQFMTRKENMKRLFEEMQSYQFHMTRSNPDAPLDEGFRLLEQEDIDRLDNAQSMEELMDIYLHFQLYYSYEIPAMQEWKQKNKAPKKKMKKKTIRVKKLKLKKSTEKKKADDEQTETDKKSEENTTGGRNDDVSDKEGEKEAGSTKDTEGEEDKNLKSSDNKTESEKEKKDTAIDPETGEPIKQNSNEDQQKSTKSNETDIEKDIDFNTNENVNKDVDEDEKSEYEDKEIEVTDSEAEPDVEETIEKKRKLPRRRDLYTICKDNGLSRMASLFGLTAEQFGENMRDNYQRHEPEQHPQEPLEAAEEFICNTFPSAEAVLSGGRHMVSFQISRDPLVKQTVRQVFRERAKIYISPTKNGKKEIDEFHQFAPFKYLKDKPVRDLHGEQFLKMWQAEQEQLVKLKLSIDVNSSNQGFSFLDEIKQLYHRDEYSHLVQEWNSQRAESLSFALNKILYPMLSKELKNKLLKEAKDFAMQACALKLRNWISVAPYQPESYDEEGDYGRKNSSTHCRVLSCSFLPDKNQASFFAMLDSDGQVVDFLRLKYLLWRRNSFKESERECKEKDMDKLKEFILKHQPQVIAIAAECRDAQSVFEDISRAVQEVEQEQQMFHIYVELVDGELARIFQDSPRAEAEFREYPSLLRHAVSIARRIQEPLVEFVALCESEDELLCLRFHPLQELLPKELLQKKLEIEFINQVNEVGVDVNRALDFPHTAPLVQFLCGLGPRKAGNLMKTLRQRSKRLENRSQLVTMCEMGLQLFLNCAGFIRIEIPDDTHDTYEVLDATRIHPETYDWPRKMALDALDIDPDTQEEMSENQDNPIDKIMAEPEVLKDLDLDAFADELARQGYGNKQITLYDIRDELTNGFKDHRTLYKGLTSEERFSLLTGETPQSLFFGKLITSVVTGFAYKKPTREELDSANPTRNDETNLWKCPFCWQDTFPDLSEVWTHFDNGSCPGQAVGVRTRLETGITGFIATKNISDKMVKRPEERVKVGMTLHARVTKINFDRIQIDLTCKSSELSDKDGNFSSVKDLYYDQEEADKDRKQEESIKAAQAKRTTYLKRVIAHPAFKNVTFKDAEKLLETMEQGDCIVRPSSKGSDHLTITWRVTKAIYQHIDIREEGKENAFSIGKSLWIDNEEYEDLDEIMARHISPMAAHTREIIQHRYYKESEGLRQKLEEILTQEKRKAPGRIPYLFSATKQFPGKFMLGYMPRNKPRIEYVTVTPDGFRYRGRIHANTNNLLKWFKEHFRDPVPGVGTPGSARRTPYSQTPMSTMSGATPYTPGSTPANLISDDEAAKLMQQAFPAGYDQQMYNNALAITPGTTPSRSTPGYSTPGFSTPGSATPQMDSNFGQMDTSFGQWGNQNQQFGNNQGFNENYNNKGGNFEHRGKGRGSYQGGNQHKGGRQRGNERNHNRHESGGDRRHRR